MTARKLCVAIPASVVSDTPHLREKTSKIGLIGRAAAIFRVEEIIVYPDNPKTNQTREIELIRLLLSYIETPQYLRKRFFGLRPELRYAGILPPLRTPHHPLDSRAGNLKIGTFREGAAVAIGKEGTLVDIGVEKPALLPSRRMPLGTRVTVKVLNAPDKVMVKLADRDEMPEYWGYAVAVERESFVSLVKHRGFSIIVATSRLGLPLADVADELARKWRVADTVLIAFGAPSRGLHEIVRNDGLSLDEVVDYVVNTIPSQATETVRTEEALIATLAVLNDRLRV